MALPTDKDELRNIQRALNETCYDQPGFVSLSADGVFGAKSQAMVLMAQKKLGFEPDGQYRGQIEAYIKAVIKERYLDDDQIRSLAAQHGIDYPTLKAIIDVESRGDGFLVNGRATILFERHKFFNEVVKVRGLAEAESLAKANPDIINRTGGGYKGYLKEWERLEKAMKLSVNGDLVEGAIRSASWGLGQIMGFHAERLGYPNAFYMFAECMRSEGGQLEAMLRFCMSDPSLARAIKNKDWKTLAKLYNGANYAVNQYDKKLEAAYNKYAQ